MAIKYIYDIFCDASVGPELRGACAGCLIINRKPGGLRTFQYAIQPNGTNNSGEIAAIALGVNAALDIANALYIQNPTFQFEEVEFNIFSDSLISINGVREWLPGWIKNMDAQGNLKNSSGNVVANQEFFKYIFNAIIASPVGFHVRFFHQDGHVTSNFNHIQKNFLKFNKIMTQDLGLEPIYLCMNNDYVDGQTRSIINKFLSQDPSYHLDEWKQEYFDNIRNSMTCDFLLGNSPNVIEFFKSKISYENKVNNI